MTERAEALRQAVSKAVKDCMPGMIPLDSSETAHVLRAVVGEIRIRSGMLGHLIGEGCSTCDDIDDALAALLEAAEDR